MKFSKIVFFLVLSVLVVFSSCKEDEISQDVVTEQPVVPETVTYNPLVANVQANVSSEEGLDLGCFSIDFPFALNFGGIEVAINSAEDFENALTDNIDEEYIDFIYPLNISLEDGTTAAVADGEELGEAFATCVPDGGWDYVEGDFPAYLICELNSCYQIVYPLNLVDADGNTYIAINEEEFIDLIAEHYDLFFEFPVNLLNENGETVTAGSDEDLFELLASCEEISWPNDTLDWNPGGGYQIACYNIDYPLSLEMSNGTTSVVNNDNEFISAVLNGDVLGFGFPINLIGEDGVSFAVNSEEELNEVFESCGFVVADLPAFILYQFASNLGFGDCYEILYPLNLFDVQGGILTIVNDTEAGDTISSSGQWFVSFPFTILVDGEETVIEKWEEIDAILVDCE